MAVEYGSTAFVGFSSNRGAIGPECAETVLAVFEEPVKVTAAGRTDTGVHASGQVVSFTTARSSFPFDRLADRAQQRAPELTSACATPPSSIGVLGPLPADERSYVYAIFNRREPSAPSATGAYHVYAMLDLDAFREAAPSDREHDFRSFCGTPPDNGNTVRTVQTLSVRRHGAMIRVGISADGFVHRMVRTVVGTLLECATGRRDPASMPSALEARMRSAAGLTAPAHGLYLAGVRYRDGYDSFAEPPVTLACEPQ